MKHGFVMVGACSPDLIMADPERNAQNISSMVRVAAQHDTKVIVFPELCVTGAGCGELFFQRGLTEAVENAIISIVDGTKEHDILVFFGTPIWVSGRIYNCAVAAAHGKIIGIVPQLNVQDTFFSPAPEKTGKAVICGVEVPFGTDLIFESLLLPELRIAAEIGTDLESPFSPAARHVAAGATVIAALTATPVAAGDSGRYSCLVGDLSGMLGCAIIRADAGGGEAGHQAHTAHNIIAEDGEVLCENRLVTMGVLASDIDVQRLDNVRTRQKMPVVSAHEICYFDTKPTITNIVRAINPGPFVWPKFEGREEWCEDILELQGAYLARRAAENGANSFVVQLDGNVGSTVAAFACSRAARKLGWENDRVIGVVSHCAGITQPTTNRASSLARSMSLSYCRIDATKAYELRLEELGTDPESDPELAAIIRRRTQLSIASDVAEQVGGLFVLSEDMTDWALGDIPSPISSGVCCVNASLPKTVLRFELVYISAQHESLSQLHQVLRAVLFQNSGGASPNQALAMKEAEQVIFTPLQMNDFFLYYILKYGFGPEKLFRIAESAFGSQLSDIQVYDCLKNFIPRFCEGQLMREGMPDSPKLLALSLNINMPSVAATNLWESELYGIMPEGYEEGAAEAEAEESAKAIIAEKKSVRENTETESREELLARLEAARVRAEALIAGEREEEAKSGAEGPVSKKFLGVPEDVPAPLPDNMTFAEKMEEMRKRAEAEIAREREDEKKTR